MEDQPCPWEGEGGDAASLGDVRRAGLQWQRGSGGFTPEKVDDAELLIPENTMHGAGQRPLCKEE